MAPVQRTFTLISLPAPNLVHRLPMTSKAAKREYMKRSARPVISPVEQRRLDKEEEKRQQNEDIKRTAAKRAKSAKNKKAAKAQAEKAARMKIGQPEPVQRDQQRITAFLLGNSLVFEGDKIPAIHNDTIVNKSDSVYHASRDELSVPHSDSAETDYGNDDFAEWEAEFAEHEGLVPHSDSAETDYGNDDFTGCEAELLALCGDSAVNNIERPRPRDDPTHDKELPSSTFSSFPRLPPEIRCRIWKASYPTTRYISISFAFESLETQGIRWTHTIAGEEPIALSVCRESRAEVLRTYKRLGNTYFDPGKDVVCLPDWGMDWASSYAIIEQFSGELRMGIRNLIIPRKPFEEDEEWCRAARYIPLWTGLERLMMATNLFPLNAPGCFRGSYVTMFRVEDVSNWRESERDIAVKCLRAACPGWKEPEILEGRIY